MSMTTPTQTPSQSREMEHLGCLGDGHNYQHIQANCQKFRVNGDQWEYQRGDFLYCTKCGHMKIAYYAQTGETPPIWYIEPVTQGCGCCNG